MAAYSACAGITAGDDFAENGQVRINSEVALSSCGADPETGNDFVEDQQRAILMSQLLAALDEFFADRPGAALGANGLHVDSSCAAGELVLFELALQILQVSREELVGVAESIARNAPGLKSLCAGDPDAVSQDIRPSVIGAAHLQDVLMTGLEPCHTGRAHAGLGAGTQHPEHLNGRHQIGDLLCQLVLELVEKPCGRTAGVQKVDDLLTDDLRVAAKHSGTACLQQIVVLIAVDVVKLRPLSLSDDYGEGIVESQIVLHSPGNDALRLRDHLFGTRALLIKVLNLISDESLRSHAVDGHVLQPVQLGADLRRVWIFIDRKTIVCHNFTSGFLLIVCCVCHPPRESLFTSYLNYIPVAGVRQVNLCS